MDQALKEFLYDISGPVYMIKTANKMIKEENLPHLDKEILNTIIEEKIKQIERLSNLAFKNSTRTANKQ